MVSAGEEHVEDLRLWKRLFMKLVILSMVIYHFYIAITGVPEPLRARPVHLAFVVFLGFIVIYPGRRDSKILAPWYDWVLALLGVAGVMYIQWDYDRIVWRLAFLDPITIGDWFFGAITILVVIELARRAVGLTLPIVALTFIGYALWGKFFPGPLGHPGIPPRNLLEHLFLSTNGLFGPLASLSMAEIFMFIFFGALLQEAGGNEFFTRVAVALTRNLRAGPAKAAVVGSALFGCVSGSGTANVYATGTVTIPLMKKIGLSSEFAAAVEAVSSTLGQLIPPVMGAAAFLVAEFSRKPYIEVAACAVLPSVLYIYAIYLSVSVRAIKKGIGKTSEFMDEVSLFDALKGYGHLLIPVLILVWLLIQRRTAYSAATIATLSIIPVSMLRSTTRLSIKRLFSGVESGVRRLVPIGATLLCAGVGVAALQTVGAPYRVAAILISLAQNNLFITLLILAVIIIILGMGLPVAGAFLIASVFGASALIELGIEPFVAYMFIFMFTLTAPITPPVCLSSYAAASIAECSFARAGWNGFILALPAYIIPFIVIYNPSLLLIKLEPSSIIIIATALLGISSLVFSVEGWMLNKLNLLERGLLFFAAFLLMYPEHFSDLVGLIIVIALFVLQLIAKRE